MRITAWQSSLVLMVLAIGAGVTVMTSLPVSAAAPPLQQWAQLYGVSSGNSVATDIAVDGSGNVYVTGWSDNRTSGLHATDESGPASGTSYSSHTDYATAKYNSAGVLQWVSRYSVNGYSAANAIAVDSAGNAYVTGVSENVTNGKKDFTTVKYSPTGAQLWVSRYENGYVKNSRYYGLDSEARDIALDGSGNLYVTGYSENYAALFGLISFKDYATVKYNSSGVQQWVSRYSVSGTFFSLPVHLDSEANAIAVDNTGNAYVTGYSENGTFSKLFHPKDYATIKYNTAGAQQWVSRYSASYSSGRYSIYVLNSIANDIALDGSGNVYVTGVSDNHASYGSTAREADVEGATYEASNTDYLTVKYSNSGAQQWAQRYSIDGDSAANAIAVDNAGNTYVTGVSDNYTHGYNAGSGTDSYNHQNTDYATLKYNTAGVQQWVARYSVNGDSAANDITLDCGGNVYVTGQSVNAIHPVGPLNNSLYSNSTVYATVKYDSMSGAQQWVMAYTATGDDSEANAIAVDCCGDVWVTGYSDSSADTNFAGSTIGHSSTYQNYATLKYVQPPTITAINPVGGQQGQCPLTVTITGTNLGGASAVSFGAGITVNSFTVNSCTQITATICIAADAVTGSRDVSVTTPGGTAVLPAGFTVNTATLVNPFIGTGGSSSVSGSTGTVGVNGFNYSPVALPNVQVQNPKLSAYAVAPGTAITVTADIVNKGTVNSSKKVTLYVNGQVETTQGITLGSGGSSKLTFNVTRSEPGDYLVYVDGVPAGSFKVELVRESDGVLIFSAILVATAFLLGLFMLWRRQRTGH